MRNASVIIWDASLSWKMHHASFQMHLTKCIRHYAWFQYISYYKALFKLYYDTRSSCIMPLSWCMMHDALCHHDAWWVSIKSQNSHKYFGLLDHTAVWIWWLWFYKSQIGPKVDNLEADPSHKKIFSDFAHNCPQVQPVFWVTAHIFKAEKNLAKSKTFKLTIGYLQK